MRKCAHGAKVFALPITETEGKMSGDQIIGISLGWEFVGKHQQGIAEIFKAFGVPGKPRRGLLGADVYTVTRRADGLKFFPNINGCAYLVYISPFLWSAAQDITAKLDTLLCVHDADESFSTAWAKDSFGVRIKNDVSDVGAMVLGQMYDAFTRLDAMIYLNKGQPRPDITKLMLTIRSRMPEKALEDMRATHEGYLNIMEAADKD
ncbi:MAG: hypothetical protein Q8P78_01970 [bacterium]|nr:hypothetical protein [bacterium]